MKAIAVILAVAMTPAAFAADEFAEIFREDFLNLRAGVRELRALNKPFCVPESELEQITERTRAGIALYERESLALLLADEKFRGRNIERELEQLDGVIDHDEWLRLAGTPPCRNPARYRNAYEKFIFEPNPSFERNFVGFLNKLTTGPEAEVNAGINSDIARAKIRELNASCGVKILRPGMPEQVTLELKDKITDALFVGFVPGVRTCLETLQENPAKVGGMFGIWEALNRVQAGALVHATGLKPINACAGPESATCPRVTRVGPGEALVVIAIEGAWARVKFADPQIKQGGYIRLSHIL